MPFGLGFFATAGVSAAGGSYDLLQTVTPNGSQSEIAFTSLSAYSGIYSHFQIRYTLRSQRAATDDALVLRFTTASGSHASHHLEGNGSTVGSTADTSSPHMYVGQFPAANFTSGAFAAGVIDILDPFSTTKNKTMRALHGRVGTSNGIRLTSGFYYGSTAALTDILVVNANGVSAFFTNTSRISLYGVKGS